VLAQCPDEDSVAVASLDLRYQQRVRQSLPCFDHIVRRDWSAS